MLGFGPDLDGDGRADLLLRAGGELKLFPGSRDAREGKGLVETTPRWSLPALGGASPEPELHIGLGGEEGVSVRMSWDPLGGNRLVDLDGDGRVEILQAAGLVDHRGFLRVLRLSR
jgi:hypothetical protein